MNNRTMISELTKCIGETKTIKGWVHIRRDHAKLTFLEIRDASSIVQAVYFKSDSKLDKTISQLRSEFVIEATGLVKARPKEMVKDTHPSGTIEFEIKDLKILSQAQTPPFEITEEKSKTHEDIRMRYRYLDLRRPQMQANMHFRHKFIKAIRDYMDKSGFIEIETPILAKSSPEGARDFLVPSRLSKGKFYALPQAPQQFKQLLMIAGFEKYYQIARCFRDEDQRGDRQPEFTQLDMEMSFVSQEEILDFNEQMFKAIITKLLPNKKLPKKFKVMSYADAIKKYGTDKPDIRKDKTDSDELAFVWVVDFPVFEKTAEGHITFAHNPFAKPLDEDLFMLGSSDQDELLKIRAHCYDLVLNGVEISSGSLRISDPKTQQAVFERFGLSQAEVDQRFGDFLEAFKYGVPPHGGFAPGLDRLLAVLLEEDSMREVIAFPKTGDARDLMFESPSTVIPEQLDELDITVKNKKS